MKLLPNKGLLIIIAFLLGIMSTYAIGDYLNGKDRSQLVHDRSKKIKKSSLRRNQIGFFDSFNQMNDQIEKRINKMFKNSMISGNFFDNSMLDSADFSTSEDGLKINNREDDRFKYIEIDSLGIDKNSLNINIANGMISLSGEIKKSTYNNQKGSRSSYNYISTFNRSFNVPFGVQEEKVQIENKKNKIIIKFPKKKL